MEKVGEIITQAYKIPYTDFSFSVNPDTIIKTWVVIAFIILLTIALRGRLRQVPHRRQILLEGLTYQ